VKSHQIQERVNYSTEKARVIEALWAEKMQLEVQLAAACLVASATEASKVSERPALEAWVKSTEDRTVIAQSAANAAASVKASL
jgi:hypothetical protein